MNPNVGVIKRVSEHLDYMFVSVPSRNRMVFAHVSQFPPGSQRLDPSMIGRTISYSHISTDIAGRDALIACRLVEKEGGHDCEVNP
ncbi:MAG TPA: hypothetical protein VGM05_33015 [Planctomycetaceae bacterium]|jgi:hypothetical protein